METQQQLRGRGDFGGSRGGLGVPGFGEGCQNLGGGGNPGLWGSPQREKGEEGAGKGQGGEKGTLNFGRFWGSPGGFWGSLGYWGGVSGILGRGVTPPLPQIASLRFVFLINHELIALIRAEAARLGQL